ncbi:MAG: hypothetical protein ACOY31_11625 [Bacillota bacterium]
MNVFLASDASGAALAGRSGLVVVVVDVIDFSTSMEAAIDGGAIAVFGARADSASPPVKTNPFLIGMMAGIKARQENTGVIVVAEPRTGGAAERRNSSSLAISGIKESGAYLVDVVPNVGSEVCLMADMRNMVVTGVTAAGGAAFDAAVCAGSPAVLTGTVARTLSKSGFSCAADAIERAVRSAGEKGTGIAVIAASGNSLEDLLGAEYIYKKMLEMVHKE